MSEAIERTLYLFAPQRMAPVRLVENSLVPIEMTLADYTIPTGATVKAYARGESSGIHRADRRRGRNHQGKTVHTGNDHDAAVWVLYPHTRHGGGGNKNVSVSTGNREPESRV